MKKKIKQTLMAIVGLLLSTSTFAHDFEVDGIYYNYLDKTNKTVEVTYRGTFLSSYSNEYTDSVIIPSLVTYSGITYSVTSIGSSAFCDCSGLTSVTIPNSVTLIDNYAFSDCSGLTSIAIPNSVTTIKTNVFENCTSLKSAIIGNSVSTIGDNTFKGCTNLNSLIFVNGIRTLSLGYNYSEHTGLFYDCPLQSLYLGRNIVYNTTNSNYTPFYKKTTLKTLEISDSVTSIGYYAFSGCSNLSAVTIPNSVISIEDNAFSNCSNLTTLSIGNSVAYIGKYAFINCSNLSGTLIIPNSVTTIGIGAFRYCTSLNSAIIGNGITELPSELFASCDNLTSVYLGNSLKSISKFWYCPKLTNLYIFSDEVTSLEKNAIPTTVSRIYVPDTKRYENLLNGYYIDNLITLNETTTEYNGKIPEFSYNNNVEDMNVSFVDSTIFIDAGSYNSKIKVLFSTENWNTSIKVPCSYTITKAPITIIANNASRQYGEDNPVFTCSYFGFKNGETDSVLTTKPIIGTTATINSIVGSYPIIPSNAEAKNYTFNYERGTLTITQASQSIIWNQEFDKVSVGDQVELLAEATSGLPIKYSVSDESIAEIYTLNGIIYLDCIKEGEITLKANQPGNDNYMSADRVTKTIKINKTSGAYNIDTENDIKVIVKNNNIIVIGIDNAPINIYNLNGQCIYSGNETIISGIAYGIYIVKINGISYKVII